MVLGLVDGPTKKLKNATDYGTPLFGQQYENKMSGRNPNKIWLSDEELNNPWKPTAGNISQNLIANFGFTLASMGMGSMISWGSKGIQGLALANNITKMNAVRSAVYATGLAIQKNIPPILGNFRGLFWSF